MSKKKQSLKSCPNAAFFFPFSLQLKPRGELMLLLMGDTTFNRLFNTPFKIILAEHKEKIELLIEKIPDLLELLDTGGSINQDEIIFVCSRLRRGTMLQALGNLIHTQPFSSKYSLIDIMENKKNVLTNGDFKNASEQLWDAGYPLLYWPIEYYEQIHDAGRTLFDSGDIGYKFLEDWGKTKVRTVYLMPLSGIEEEAITSIKDVRELIRCPNCQNEHCCVDRVECKWNGDTNSLCGIADEDLPEEMPLKSLTESTGENEAQRECCTCSDPCTNGDSGGETAYLNC